MNDDSQENEVLSEELDFFKQMDEIVKAEAQKKKVILHQPPSKEELTPNREYQRRYSRSPHDHTWIGPQRYR